MAPPVADGLRHLALVVVQPDAVVRAGGRTGYGTYDLFVPPNTRRAHRDGVARRLREAIVSPRGFAPSNLDRGAGRSRDARSGGRPSVTVAAGAERQTNVGFNRTLPFVFAGLLVFGVMIGGQTLLTSDGRGEVEPRDRGAALGGVADSS